jgi:hypothetical protein
MGHCSPGRLQAVTGRGRQSNGDNQRQMTASRFSWSPLDLPAHRHIFDTAEHPLQGRGRFARQALGRLVGCCEHKNQPDHES